MFLKSNAASLPLWAVAGVQLVVVSAHALAGGRPDPAEPKAPVPTALYVSPLRAYQAFTEAGVAPWRETNDLVRRRGGGHSHASEATVPQAAEPTAPGAAPPAQAARPAPNGHAGHEMK